MNHLWLTGDVDGVDEYLFGDKVAKDDVKRVEKVAKGDDHDVNPYLFDDKRVDKSFDCWDWLNSWRVLSLCFWT